MESPARFKHEEESNTPLSRAQTKRRPVGGEDRAPACQKRLGESGPAGETGPGLRGHVTLSASGSGRWGRPCQYENANHAYIRGKKRICRGGTKLFLD